ncbi:MAG: hypothetical protein WCS03_05690 [Bacteroidota bacterium]
MKKHILLIIILLISVFQLSAQKTKDVLYLKNGSIIYGRLIEIADEQYKMRTTDGSIFIYKSSEVEKFAKESPLFDGRKEVGFGFSLEAGFLIGSQHTEYPTPFSFNFLGSAASNTTNITSLGSGVEFYGRPYTPLFLEYKHIFFNKKTTPFIFVRGGGVIPLGRNEESTSTNYNYSNGPKDYKGGGSFAVGTGISWAKEEYETYLSFAYRYAKTSYSQEEYNLGVVTYDNKLNRLEIKFGYKF